MEQVITLNTWTYALASVFIVSIISLIGVITLSLREKQLKKVLLLLVSFSAGALLANAFLHLIPEATEKAGFTIQVGSLVLGGIILFFVLEKIINWRHCHHPTSEKHPHPYATTNLVGDGLHNFMDGVIIGASYMAGTTVGIATTVAVILHEIPQEIGDFGVLIHAGMNKTKALLFNFLTAITAFVGVVFALLLGGATAQFAQYLLPLTAGGFIYIAASDLIPQLHKEQQRKRSLKELTAMLLGIGIMYALIFI